MRGLITAKNAKYVENWRSCVTFDTILRQMGHKTLTQFISEF